MTPKPPNLIIRPLASKDESQWHALFADYLVFYQSSLPDEVCKSSFARLLGNDPQDYNGFVAEIDGKLVGFSHYLLHRHGWKIENTCYLQDLFADPEIRGRGIGRALIEAVYGAADKAGAPSVYWLTQDFNTDARKLYDRIAVKTPFIKYQRP